MGRTDSPGAQFHNGSGFFSNGQTFDFKFQTSTGGCRIVAQLCQSGARSGIHVRELAAYQNSAITLQDKRINSSIRSATGIESSIQSPLRQKTSQPWPKFVSDVHRA